jgi:pilus assembly protein Flp/PilA
MEFMKNFFKDEQGASAVEYAVLVGVVVVTLLTGVTAFYNALNNKLTSAAQVIGP